MLSCPHYTTALPIILLRRSIAYIDLIMFVCAGAKKLTLYTADGKIPPLFLLPHLQHVRQTHPNAYIMNDYLFYKGQVSITMYIIIIITHIISYFSCVGSKK